MKPNGNCKKSPGPATVRLCVILSILGVSLSAVFVRFSHAPSQTLAMLRMTLSALLFLPVILFRHQKDIRLMSRRDILRCAAGGLALGLHFLTYFESIKNTSLASGLILVNTEVFFVAVMLFVLYREKLSRLGILGVIMAFAGGAAVALGSLDNGTDTLYGNVLAVVSAMCLCAYTLLGRSLRRRMGGTVLSFTVYLGAAVVLGAVMLLTGESLASVTWLDFFCALGMAVFCTLLGHSVCLWALKYLPATFISVSRLLEPVFSSIWGVFLFSEIPGAWQLAGGAVVIGGVLIYGLATERDEKHSGRTDTPSNP